MEKFPSEARKVLKKRMYTSCVHMCFQSSIDIHDVAREKFRHRIRRQRLAENSLS